MREVELVSPLNGKPLQRLSDYLLDDGERRWPVVDGIAWLRPKEELRRASVRAIERGDPREAMLLLLADQDRFSPTEPPARTTLEALVDGPPPRLRHAMELLNYGPVGEYFAYRWCSPTFASGLDLLERAAAGHLPFVEYACGVGHFLRELEMNGGAAVGVDIVFSKLWLARHCLEVRGPLVCGDVERSTVVAAAGEARNVFCHDAFYFFEDKRTALDNMRQVAGPAGSLAVGHVHTERNPHRAGFSKTLADYAALTEAPLYDDGSLAASFYGLSSEPMAPSSDTTAVAWYEHGAGGAGAQVQRLRFTKRGKQCSDNPLLRDGTMTYPSEGWREEYEVDMAAVPAQRRRSDDDYRAGRTLNLPERW